MNNTIWKEYGKTKCVKIKKINFVNTIPTKRLEFCFTDLTQSVIYFVNFLKLLNIFIKYFLDYYE